MTTFGSLQEARSGLSREAVDLLLLEVNIQDGSGFEFCVELRNNSRSKHLPIIFLTSKSDTMDKVMGFSVGADDYVLKPFDPMELKARIIARLRAKDENSDDHFVKSHIKFDRSRIRAYFIEGSAEKDLKLTPLEFKILYQLAANAGKVFSRQQLLREVNEPQIHVSSDNIYTHICAIRRKLGPRRDYVECLPRVGYRFNDK